LNLNLVIPILNLVIPIFYLLSKLDNPTLDLYHTNQHIMDITYINVANCV